MSVGEEKRRRREWRVTSALLDVSTVGTEERLWERREEKVLRRSEGMKDERASVVKKREEKQEREVSIPRERSVNQVFPTSARKNEGEYQVLHTHGKRKAFQNESALLFALRIRDFRSKR